MTRLLPVLLVSCVGLAAIAASPAGEATGYRSGHDTHTSFDTHGRHWKAKVRHDRRTFRRVPKRSRPGACNPKRTRGMVTARCARALLANPDVAAILDDRTLVPALADGRLSTEAMLRQLELSDASGLTRRGAEPDPEEVVTVDPRTLEWLSSVEPRVEPDAVFTRAGPILSESYAPIGPEDFPVRMPDDRTFLDIAGFSLDLHAVFSPHVNGYAMRMRQNGQTVSTLQWNWARNPNPADAPAAGWNTSRRMHIVSLSKFMSTIGLVHMLRAKGINTDAKIIDHLPDYWSKGPNIDRINFEDLMNHLSGFSTGGSASDWQTMKSNVAAGVTESDVGKTRDYENMNFGLLRILMATIGGYVNPSTDFGLEFLNDLTWDFLSTASYEHYMRKHVFNPVGAFPLLAKTATTALGHRYDAAGTGWDTGSFFGQAAGVGWHFTINEVLDVARAFRLGHIVDLSDALEVLDESWGLGSPVSGHTTTNGPVYWKSGLWQDNDDASVARTEQCVLMMLPDNTEVAMFVNSPITASGLSLTSLVRTIYENNLVTLP